MSLPKKLATGVRYLSSSAYNSRVTFVNPDAGQEADGTPLPETTVKTNVWASVTGRVVKEVDKQETQQAVSYYKIVIHYPKGWSVDAGMTVLFHNQRHNIEGLLDPDGQKVELHLFTWVGDDSVGVERF